MNKIETIQNKVDKIMSSYNKHSFSGLLVSLRKAYSLTRQSVASDLNLGYFFLFYLETGSFKFTPTREAIHKIADYYDVQYEILDEKLKQHLAIVRKSKQDLSKPRLA